MANIIAYVSLKGGTGKSSLTILTANYAAKLGKKVLVIDLDLQNSTSFYYHPEEINPTHNIAVALQLLLPIKDIIVPTIRENVHLAASSLSLADTRTIDEKRLNKILKPVANDYDLILIDTPPTYDNIVLNGIRAANKIYTPLNPTQFDIKSALFIRDKLTLDVPEKLNSWQVLVNNLDRRNLKGENCLTAQYLTLIYECFQIDGQLAPYQIPSRINIKKAIDGNEALKLDMKEYFSVEFVAHMTAVLGAHTPPAEV